MFDDITYYHRNTIYFTNKNIDIQNNKSRKYLFALLLFLTSFIQSDMKFDSVKQIGTLHPRKKAIMEIANTWEFGNKIYFANKNNNIQISNTTK